MIGIFLNDDNILQLLYFLKFFSDLMFYVTNVPSSVRGCASVHALRVAHHHGNHVNFGGTSVHVYVYQCVIVSFLLLRGIGQPLFRNFGRTFVYVCARV